MTNSTQQLVRQLNPCGSCPQDHDNLPDALFVLLNQIDDLDLGIDARDAITQALCEGCPRAQ
jgi:hypothetical protein